jgi:hypothetical protein
MRFSQRVGVTPSTPPLQREVVESATRVRLWNALHIIYWENAGAYELDQSELHQLMQLYWHHFFHRPLDTIPEYTNGAVQIVREEFNNLSWHELLDFLEFTADNGPESRAEAFRKFVNAVLKQDNSAYRFVGTEVSEITSPVEIEAIEQSFEATSRVSGINTHLRSALAHLSNRPNPDFRNSIKESVSAVEGVVQLLTGDENATLGTALGILEKRGQLHGALKSSLSSLYGYTSDADGIRHAMLDESKLSFTDAKFMLVTCAAFVSYLLAKAADLGIPIPARA